MADGKEKKQPMTVSEAGRKGGKKVAEKYGHAFYEEIGKKGGETVKAERGRAFYEEIGRKGGAAVRANHGKKFYTEIGKKGGQRTKELVELGKHPSYATLGKKGGQRVRELIAEGKHTLARATSNDAPFTASELETKSAHVRGGSAPLSASNQNTKVESISLSDLVDPEALRRATE